MKADLSRLRWKPGGEPRKETARLTWVTDHLIPLAAVFGTLLYALLRINYVFFYEPLRVTPEEVGIGFPQVLSLAAPGLILLFIFSFLAFLVLTLLVVVLAVLNNVYVWLVHFLLEPLLSRRDLLSNPSVRRLAAWVAPADRFQLRTVARRLTVSGAVIGLLVSILVVNYEINLAARRAAFRAQLGRPVRVVALGDVPVIPWPPRVLARNVPGLERLYGLLATPVLNVRATPVDLVRLDPSAPKIGPRDCALYLGQSDGVTVLFVLEYGGAGSAYGHSVIRVPSSAIATTTKSSC